MGQTLKSQRERSMFEFYKFLINVRGSETSKCHLVTSDLAGLKCW